MPILIERARLGSSALAVKGRSIKKDEPLPPDHDDVRPEYGSADLQGGVRGKYLERFRSGTNLAKLDPDVRDAFPSDAAVNDALRSLIGK